MSNNNNRNFSKKWTGRSFIQTTGPKNSVLGRGENRLVPARAVRGASVTRMAQGSTSCHLSIHRKFARCGSGRIADYHTEERSPWKDSSCARESKLSNEFADLIISAIKCIMSCTSIKAVNQSYTCTTITP